MNSPLWMMMLLPPPPLPVMSSQFERSWSFVGAAATDTGQKNRIFLSLRICQWNILDHSCIYRN